MKLEKLGNLSQVVLFVSPASYKNKNTMNLYVRISSKKLGYVTHLFQETKLGSVISNIVPSSLHTRNISPPILVARPKGYNSNPLNLFWESLMCITKQITLLPCIQKNDQWVFLQKAN
jgi:hypothetical protein